MEKSLPNPIALAASYDIRIMACAGRAGGGDGGGRRWEGKKKTPQKDKTRDAKKKSTE